MGRYSFFQSLYTLRKLPSIYEKIYYRDKNPESLVFENINKGIFLEDQNSLIVEDIPDYLVKEESHLSSDLGRVAIKKYPGFLIDFKDISSVEQYLKLRFGKSSRYKLQREIKKLEFCFDISYKFYFGEITKKEYDNILDSLYQLLESRSNEKGIDENINFKERSLIQKITYSMILNKNASLFVIYNKDKPIDICLNYHLESVVYQHIRTYDIAYSKFNTGYTDLIKQIEWCIFNNINAIIFSKGDFYWKRRWCNVVYDYYHHVYYRKNSFYGRLVVFQQKAINFLYSRAKQYKLVEKYHNYKNEQIKLRNLKEEPNLKVLDLEEKDPTQKWVSVDYETSHVFIRRTINNFLYESNQNQSEIKVFECEGDKDRFLIKGPKEALAFSISN